MSSEQIKKPNALLSARDERRRILGSPNYNRMGYTEKEVVAATMEREFSSPLVTAMRSSSGLLRQGSLTVKLAESFGFCWGVERAVRFSLILSSCNVHL
jgi:4-hydroxy-3-methylbut-2-enyl diphosphate reductase